MYKVNMLNEAMATRTIELENIDTGAIELCFDDSTLTSSENFEFMEIGELYECKILLFGDITKEKTEKSVKCKILNGDIQVGTKILAEVVVGKDIYYIPQRQIQHFSEQDSFEFEFTRKDLIQVNAVIHGDLLTELW